MNFKKIKLKIKLMGVNCIIPIFIIFIPIILLMKRDIKSIDSEALSILELFIPLSCAWITIFDLKDIFEISGNELIFSIEKNRKNLGVYKVFKGVICYSAIMSIAIFILSIQIESLNFISVSLQLLMVGIFLSSITFLIMVIFENSLVAIILAVIYPYSMLFIGQAYFDYINIFIFGESINDISVVFDNFIKIIIYSLVFIALAQFNVNKKKKFICE